MHHRLYYSMSCGFCIRVLRALEDMDLEIELCDVRANPDAYREMARITGKRQVPCLFRFTGDDPGKESPEWLFESRDIVDYLEQLAG